MVFFVLNNKGGIFWWWVLKDVFFFLVTGRWSFLSWLLKVLFFCSGYQQWSFFPGVPKFGSSPRVTKGCLFSGLLKLIFLFWLPWVLFFPVYWGGLLFSWLKHVVFLLGFKGSSFFLATKAGLFHALATEGGLFLFLLLKLLFFGLALHGSIFVLSPMGSLFFLGNQRWSLFVLISKGTIFCPWYQWWSFCTVYYWRSIFPSLVKVFFMLLKFFLATKIGCFWSWLLQASFVLITEHCLFLHWWPFHCWLIEFCPCYQRRSLFELKKMGFSPPLL